MTDAQTLDRAAARAVMLAAQGLAGPLPTVPPAAEPPPPSRVVRDHGHVRTLGGSEAYVAVQARRGELRREVMDDEVAAGDLHVVPAARGCIYLVHRDEVPWALRLAEELSRSRSEREQERAGVRPGEMEELGERVVTALRAHGPLDPNALRRTLPDDAVRSLGDAGKKVGLSSTLPPALRRLEFDGRVERRLEGGRLDSERYLWAVPEQNPFDGVDVADAAALHRHFAARWFRWSGLGTADAFAAWAGLGKRDARAAAAELELTPVEVAGQEGDWLADPQVLAAATDATVSGGALLPFEDNLIHLQDSPALLTDPEHLELEVPSWGRRGRVPLGTAKHLAFRAVVADGRLSGFWDFDPDSEEVVIGYFADPSPAARDEIQSKAVALSRLLAEDLGHGRSFSLDNDDTLRRRVAEIRELGA